MKLNSLLSFLTPKEDKFFPMIIEVGDNCIKAAELLTQFFEEKSPELRRELYPQIKACEIAGDHLVDDLYKELNDTFITPFDREDIHDLCESLDDVLDYICSSAKRTIMFKPNHIPKRTIALAQNIHEGCVAISKALAELPHLSKNNQVALEQCACLHDLEHVADDIYEQFVTDLFEEETNSIELIKLKEIMQELEKATDKSKSVGKVVKTIVVKYA